VDPSDIGDREAVVGDECHIVAQHPGGARATEPLSVGIDDYQNLILLCKADHKRVDDQPAHYTPERLRELKTAHERRFARTDDPPPVRVVDDPTVDPAVPERVGSGGDLWNAIAQAHSWRFNHPNAASDSEAEILACALDSISDWAQASSDIGPGDSVRAARALGEELDALTQLGLVVYATRHRSLLTGGTAAAPTPWRETVLWIVRTPTPSASGERDAPPADV
jgi:hypothetical protein